MRSDMSFIQIGITWRKDKETHNDVFEDIESEINRIFHNSTPDYSDEVFEGYQGWTIGLHEDGFTEAYELSRKFTEAVFIVRSLDYCSLYYAVYIEGEEKLIKKDIRLNNDELDI